MPDVPAIRYAKSGDVHIAYQVVGAGRWKGCFTPGISSNRQIVREWLEWSRSLCRLAAVSRFIRFDMRGVGLADRGARPLTLELRVDDVAAVMNAERSPSAVALGGAEGTP